MGCTQFQGFDKVNIIPSFVCSIRQGGLVSTSKLDEDRRMLGTMLKARDVGESEKFKINLSPDDFPLSFSLNIDLETTLIDE